MNAVNLEETGLHEPEVLRRLVDIIVREADPEAIILFGSRARGDARADSDIDLLVIEREPSTPTAPSLRVRRYASSSHIRSMWCASVVSTISGACLAKFAIFCW